MEELEVTRRALETSAPRISTDKKGKHFGHLPKFPFQLY